jgi:hypothetical protein
MSGECALDLYLDLDLDLEFLETDFEFYTNEFFLALSLVLYSRVEVRRDYDSIVWDIEEVFPLVRLISAILYSSDWSLEIEILRELFSVCRLLVFKSDINGLLAELWEDCSFSSSPSTIATTSFSLVSALIPVYFPNIFSSMKAMVMVFLAKLFFRLLFLIFFSSRLTSFYDLSLIVLIVPIGLLSPDLT